MKKYRSNGKLFLIGEYIVMDGAKALALPTKFGQCLFVEDCIESNVLNWKALKHDQSVWFEAQLSLDDFSIISSTHQKITSSLQHILQQAQTLNPVFFESNQGYNCITHLEYPQEWGLGSSSTLVDLISQWLAIDPFHLNQLTFQTSGYDIACAHHNQPILFTNQPNIQVEELFLDWNFLDDLYFVYLNQKQDTQAVVGNHYKNKPKDWTMVERLSKLVEQTIHVKTLQEFESIMIDYQEQLAAYMQIPAVKTQYFEDYDGVVKSLGAWGGDFVLVTKREGFETYFNQKGYNIIVPFREMIL